MRRPAACFVVHEEVAEALKSERGVVALETTLLSHGLPWPQNLETAQQAEQAVRLAGAVPATIAVLRGQLHIGLQPDDLLHIAQSPEIFKASAADLGPLLAARMDGSTTVSATVVAAARVGISVMATGGLGGVHRGDAADVSSDLTTLAQTPVAVVSAGPKAILDLPRTLEWLETFGVPVIGIGTDRLPAFYVRHSGLALAHSVPDAAAAARLVAAHWTVFPSRGVLLCKPIGDDQALPEDLFEQAFGVAMSAAQAQQISGKALTPFLLSHIARGTGLNTVRANQTLIVQNAAFAGQLAVALCSA